MLLHFATNFKHSGKQFRSSFRSMLSYKSFYSVICIRWLPIKLVQNSPSCKFLDLGSSENVCFTWNPNSKESILSTILKRFWFRFLNISWQKSPLLSKLSDALTCSENYFQQLSLLPSPSSRGKKLFESGI